MLILERPDPNQLANNFQVSGEIGSSKKNIQAKSILVVKLLLSNAAADLLATLYYEWEDISGKDVL